MERLAGILRDEDSGFIVERHDFPIARVWSAHDRYICFHIRDKPPYHKRASTILPLYGREPGNGGFLPIGG